MGFVKNVAGKAGMTLGQLLLFFQGLDGDTVTLLTRFAMRAVKSGDANAYVKAHLQRIVDSEDAAELASRGVVTKGSSR